MQTYIEIKFSEPIKVLEVLKKMGNDGWSFNDYGKISFLENNDFDWGRFDLEEIESVKLLIQQKIEKQELIGIALINNEINSGGLFHFENDRLWISISINRKCIHNDHFTDFSLYIKYLKNTLDGVISIYCQDIF